jgi:hypothetical protein
MASDGNTVDSMQKAAQYEKKYQWKEAAETYEQMQGISSATPSQKAEAAEKIGFAYGLASRQASSVDEFMELRQKAVAAYRNAAQQYINVEGVQNEAKAAHSIMLEAYNSCWLTHDPVERRRLLDCSCAAGKESLDAYQSARDKSSYAKACNDMLVSLIERLYVASDAEEMSRVADLGALCAGEAIKAASVLDAKEGLAWAHSLTSLQGWYAANICEDDTKRKEIIQKCLGSSQKSIQLSESISDPYCIAMAHWAASLCTLFFTDDIKAAVDHGKKMLAQANVVEDNYLRGVAEYLLAFATDWMVLREEDPDRKKEQRSSIVRYSEDAIRNLELVSQDFLVAQTCLFYAETYSALYRETEASLEERLGYLDKAMAIGRTGLEHALRSGSPDATGSTSHALSKALHFYANLKTEKNEKRKMLQEALAHRKVYNDIVEKAFTANDWLRCVGKIYGGIAETELSRTMEDQSEKQVLLEKACANMEGGIVTCRRWSSHGQAPSLIAAAGEFEHAFGRTVEELYEITRDERTLQKAVEAYDEAAKKFRKLDLPTRVAESLWKKAKVQDDLGLLREAAESFAGAFEHYKIASDKIPNFVDFFLDHAAYMKAWSEIEKAKFAHKHEDYAQAMNHYAKTAELLKPSETWGYLSKNFLAWSALEHAEGLSRTEMFAESAGAFKKAAEVFEEAKDDFQAFRVEPENADETKKTTELREVSSWRKDYCLARVNVEDARICDQEGEYAESAENYSSAAATFERLLERVTSATDQVEIRSIVYMCRAWEKMKLADARSSSELYEDASKLFSEAKEHSTRAKVTLLASGNSAFCQALEHGVQYEKTRDKEDFLKVKRFLENAANSYLKAGFERASAWTSATEMLFDAYNYLTSAETEADPGSKTRSYSLAEKCLERSAYLYETSGYVGKKDEVLKLLKKVREKYEFALSLGQILSAPREASSTSAIAAHGMNIEEPVGLLKFEKALVQANVIVHQTEVGVGENFNLEIQLANLGKDTAFLSKIVRLIPEGFEPVQKPEKCILAGDTLLFRGKRLAPLESCEMHLSLKPRKKGRCTFQPSIEYVNESGEHRTCELEQINVDVKELGIRDWLKGPR